MPSESSSSSGGIGLLGMLTVLFVGLELTGYINWSWFWVLSPTLIPLGIAIAILLILGVLHITSR